jgi:hypothetical protein
MADYNCLLIQYPSSLFPSLLVRKPETDAKFLTMADIPKSNNRQIIEDAREIQESTKAALTRIQQHVAITEEVGMSTLEELEDQKHRRKQTLVDIQNVNAHAKKTNRLIGRFDVWAGNWAGFKKTDAKMEASETLAALQRDLKRSAIERERSTKSTAVGGRGFDLNQLKKNVRPGSISKRKSPLPPCQTTTNHQHGGSPAAAAAAAAAVAPEELDEESKAGLEMLERTDKEIIDSMLDEVAASLDRLDTMSNSMLQEIKSQKIESNEVERQLHKAVKRKTFSNARIKNVLTGKWKNRHSGYNT